MTKKHAPQTDRDTIRSIFAAYEPQEREIGRSYSCKVPTQQDDQDIMEWDD